LNAPNANPLKMEIERTGIIRAEVTQPKLGVFGCTGMGALDLSAGG
jgi:hypothetical protein